MKEVKFIVVSICFLFLFQNGAIIEKVITHYNNGNKRFIKKYEINNKKEILIQDVLYSIDGKVIERISFNKNNKKIENFFLNEKIKSLFFYKNSKRNGEWKFWYENGQLEGISRYRDGVFHGKEIEFDKKGNKIGEGNYVNGTGEFRGWYQDGSKRSESIIKKCKGKETTFYKNGKKKSEMSFSNCLQNGKYFEWYENGHKKTEMDFRNDELNGLLLRWHQNGKKNVEAEYLNGNNHGKVLEWDERGNKIIEGNLIENSGTWKKWNSSGKVIINGELIHGHFCGKHINWYRSGEKKGESNFKNGIPDGYKIKWNKSGKIILKEFYKKGKLVKLF